MKRHFWTRACYLANGIGLILTLALSLYAARPFSPESHLDSVYILFMIWSLTPYGILAAWAFLFKARLLPRVLVLLGSLAVIVAGLVIYIHTLFFQPDAQGGLVFVFVPFYQIKLAALLAAVVLITRFIFYRKAGEGEDILGLDRERLFDEIAIVFPGEDPEIVLAVLDQFQAQCSDSERMRVMLAVLELSGGDLVTLLKLIDEANIDYRDILDWVEYPKEDPTWDRSDSPADIPEAKTEG